MYNPQYIYNRVQIMEGLLYRIAVWKSLSEPQQELIIDDLEDRMLSENYE